ncbi:thiolase-like protein [Aspergillus desertorum]
MTTYPIEPIAIIGSGCRFPGNANNPSALWDLLKSPTDCLSEIPENRFNWRGYHYNGQNGPHHGAIITKHTHFLSSTTDITRFDAPFFSIKPADADAMDPQQRLLLETVYEGLENAGLTIESLRGSDTAVYVGLMNCDYEDLLQNDIDCIPPYAGTGVSRSIHSNRISWFFDWRGPSMTIDTACSSSMMAVHLAVQSLRSGEARVAVACGASVLISPHNYIVLSQLGMISSDGRGRMWDANANGYSRGEGVASIILKPLTAAIADGDPIDCIIRETGVNHDGHTRRITVPSSEAQADLIRKTYARAGLDVSKREDRPQYFEAHGTGTMVGDPREADAVHNAFSERQGQEPSNEDVIHIGSIKTVIGHTEATAGIAGILKAAFAVKHGYIPPNMLFDSLNPAVAPYARYLCIPTELKPWPVLPEGVPRRASVNGFGFGGSNGHAILESFHAAEATSKPTKPDKSTSIVSTPFVFSAQSERSLISMLQNFKIYLETHSSEADLRSIAYTLQYRRSLLSLRTAIMALDKDDLQSKLQKVLSSSSGTPAGVKPTLQYDTPRILGIFTGQGAQWTGMFQSLLNISPRAREIICSLEHSLATLPREQDRPSWRISDELMESQTTSRISEAAVSQPLCTAVQILLVDMLRSAGVQLHAVVGHSSGEIAAAYAAGFITAADAIRIAYYRGLCARLAGGRNEQRGAMIATGLSPTEAHKLCDSPQFHGRLDVAALNSPASVVLSGDVDALHEVNLRLIEEKKHAQFLNVDTAYHSHHMLPCAEPYLEALKSCAIRPAEGSQTIWLSSVFPGRIMSPANSAQLSSEYWVANMTGPVYFTDALSTTLTNPACGPFDLSLEVGPHPALRSAVLQNMQEAGLGDAKLPYIGALARGQNDLLTFAEALGKIWAHCPHSTNTIDFARYDQTFFPFATPVFFIRAST